jgi:hypothetical protein
MFAAFVGLTAIDGSLGRIAQDVLPSPSTLTWML